MSNTRRVFKQKQVLRSLKRINGQATALVGLLTPRVIEDARDLDPLKKLELYERLSNNYYNSLTQLQVTQSVIRRKTQQTT